MTAPASPTTRARPPPRRLPTSPPWASPRAIIRPSTPTTRPVRNGRRSTRALRTSIRPPIPISAAGTSGAAPPRPSSSQSETCEPTGPPSQPSHRTVARLKPDRDEARAPRARDGGARASCAASCSCARARASAACAVTPEKPASSSSPWACCFCAPVASPAQPAFKPLCAGRATTREMIRPRRPRQSLAAGAVRVHDVDLGAGAGKGDLLAVGRPAETGVADGAHLRLRRPLPSAFITWISDTPDRRE